MPKLTTDPLRLKRYLIFSAASQSLRIVTQPPRLSWDEIYWTLDLSVPQPWGKFAGAITIDLPEGAAPIVQIRLAEPTDA